MSAALAAQNAAHIITIIERPASSNTLFDNLIFCTGGGGRTYDAEGRMTSAWGGGYQHLYTYNAAGQRARRTVNGVTTWQVYGFDGELVAEYAHGAAPSTPQKEYGYRAGELLVTADVPVGGNLALGKTATQSSDYSHSCTPVAAKAVDGNPSGIFTDCSTTSTNHEQQAWWQVDLGSVQQLGDIKVWNRTDCCSDRLSNFYVLVSDVAFTSTDLTATLNQAGVSSYYVAGTAPATLTQAVGRSGRYVRVQLTGSNYLSLAEVEVIGGAGGGGGVQWLVSDHLGTPRMVVEQTGQLAHVKRHDYLPYGEELFAGVGGRTTAQGYSQVDNVRQKFTGYERDGETGLDYAQARYYSSTQGRFTSVDPALGSMDFNNPQSFNRYTYALNNPLAYVDPTGTIPVWVKDKDDNIRWQEYDPTSEFDRDNYTPLTQAELEYDSVTGQRVRLDPFGPSRENPTGFTFIGPNQGSGAGAALGAAGVAAIADGPEPGPGDLVALGIIGGALITHMTAQTLQTPLIISPVILNEGTPATNPGNFEPVRGSSAKKAKDTGEVWVKDRFHKDHYEVYKNKKDYEKGRRDRSVWEDGRPKEKF